MASRKFFAALARCPTAADLVIHGSRSERDIAMPIIRAALQPPTNEQNAIEALRALWTAIRTVLRGKGQTGAIDFPRDLISCPDFPRILWLRSLDPLTENQRALPVFRKRP